MVGNERRFSIGGGIGSGKTAAASCFASFGAIVISSDEVAKAVLAAGTPQTAAVMARWPQASRDGTTIDRALLGRLVFPDPVRLAELEEIVHPETARRILEEIGGHDSQVAMVEFPVLRDVLDTAWPWIVVDAPETVRVHRAAARGFFSEDEVREVIARQPSRGEWLAAAAWVVDNSGDQEHLERECRRVWDKIGDGR
jgi:dephospho-CoA kinase